MRPKQTELSDKQVEVYDILLRGVANNGHPPALSEVAEILRVKPPAVGSRVRQLLEKGVLVAAGKKGSARTYRFPGLKFLPYSVAPDGSPEPQVVDMGGGWVAEVRRGKAQS